MRKKQEFFRASWAIRLAVLVALMAWMLVAGALLLTADMPLYTFASTAFFVLFFLVFVAYYWSMTYVVDEYGVTYRGATDFEHFPWEEITQVEHSEIPLGGYYVSTKRGGFVLSNFVKGRERLVELIIARAGLFPSG